MAMVNKHLACEYMKRKKQKSERVIRKFDKVHCDYMTTKIFS